MHHSHGDGLQRTGPREVPGHPEVLPLALDLLSLLLIGVMTLVLFAPRASSRPRDQGSILFLQGQWGRGLLDGLWFAHPTPAWSNFKSSVFSAFAAPSLSAGSLYFTIYWRSPSANGACFDVSKCCRQGAVGVRGLGRSIPS